MHIQYITDSEYIQYFSSAQSDGKTSDDQSPSPHDQTLQSYEDKIK